MTNPFQPMVCTVRTGCLGSTKPSFVGNDSSSRIRTYNCLLGLLQYALRHLGRNRWEFIQKFGNRFACFNVLKQNPHRHTRTGKNRCAAQDEGVGFYEVCIHGDTTIRSTHPQPVLHPTHPHCKQGRVKFQLNPLVDSAHGYQCAFYGI